MGGACQQGQDFLPQRQTKQSQQRHQHVSPSVPVNSSLTPRPHSILSLPSPPPSASPACRTVMAHGTLLSDDDIKHLASRGTAVSHCPLSNFFLGDAFFK